MIGKKKSFPPFWGATFSGILPLLLLVCCTTNAMAEFGCMYDEIMRLNGPESVVVVQNLPKTDVNTGHLYTAMTAENNEWSPIRIFVSSEDLSLSSKFCTADGVKRREKRPDFLGSHRSCDTNSVLTNEKKEILLKKLIPATIKLHSERLMVQPVRGNLIVPKLDGTRCAHFTIPATHQTEGVPNADKVLYVAAPPGPTWAVTCAALDTQKGRPIASAMSFAASLIALTHERVRTCAHELAHALGFNYENMLQHGLIENVTDIRGKKHKVSVVIGDKTKEAVQKHFNCSSATGMELEDEGPKWFPGAHWERRNAKDELMNAYVGIGLYTALTMSFFEDLKYYKAQWGMEEPMSWGSNAGCDFLEKKCIENGRNPFPEMFCTESKCNQVSCTSDRMAVAECDLEKPRESLADYYQYFADPTFVGARLALTDYCPIITDQLQFCTNTFAKDLMSRSGSLVGEYARCLKGDALKIDGRTIGDVCAEVRCNVNKTVHVRYLGDEEYYECTEGKTITPTATFSGGSIKCPKFEEVCTVGKHGESLVTMPENEN